MGNRKGGAQLTSTNRPQGEIKKERMRRVLKSNDAWNYYKLGYFLVYSICPDRERAPPA